MPAKIHKTPLKSRRNIRLIAIVAAMAPTMPPKMPLPNARIVGSGSHLDVFQAAMRTAPSSAR